MTDAAKSAAYNRAVTQWHESVVEYEAALLDHAEADARHRSNRAKAIVRARHGDPKMSHALAEAIGDADEQVIPLALARLVKSAQVEGLKQRLYWHRAHADNLRTQVVDERAQNAFTSQAGAGPGRTTFEPRTEPQWSKPEESTRPSQPAQQARPSQHTAQTPPTRPAPVQRPPKPEVAGPKIY